MVTHYRQGCITGAGWCCLWDAAAFRHVIDESTHYEALIDDEGVRRSIASGGLVPVNDFGDGGYDIGVRIADSPNDSPISGEEISSAIAKSKPYRFSTSGDVCVSGMEFVGEPIDNTHVTRHGISPGTYVAKVYRFGPDSAEMPEFLVVLQPLAPEHEDIEFCTDDDTFGQQPTLPTGHVGFRVHTCSDWRKLKQRLSEITGHEKSTVGVATKSHEPLYLGNGYQNPERIAAMVQPLMEAVAALGGTFEFVLDGQQVEPSTLLTTFRGEGSG
jgi:hypothetical protein